MATSKLEFEELFARFARFAEENSLGRLIANQWKLAYIDSFPQDEHWTTPAD